MPSYDFIKHAKTLAVRDKPTFDALMEYESTKKIRSKLRMNFTIDKSLAARFKKYAKENSLNMSAAIEKAIRKMIE